MADVNLNANIEGPYNEAANTFMNRLFDFFDGFLEPRRVKKLAEANAEKAKIEARSEIEVAKIRREAEIEAGRIVEAVDLKASETRLRALRRFAAEEVRKQINIEGIAAKALPHIKKDARPNDIEDDWLANFFDKARLISDEEMQELWARVLSGEANEPKSYSVRTLSLLSYLDKRDAELFTNLCGFAIHIGGPTPLIFDIEDAIYKEQKISFSDLTHLDSIGLVSFNTTTEYLFKGLSDGLIRYFDEELLLHFTDQSKNNLVVGTVLLTEAGKDLANVCQAEKVEGFASYAAAKWSEKGVWTSTPVRRLNFRKRAS